MELHRCRFVPYNPQAINALDFSHPPSHNVAGLGAQTLRLAVGRANGDIEIWNPLRGAWFQETILRGGKDRSIEGLAWTLDPAEDHPDGSGTKIPGRLRLFSIGYSSTVTEWDLDKGKPARHSSGSYGEIWCLAAQPRWKPEKGKTQPDEGEYVGQHLAVGCADGSIIILSTADNDLTFVRRMQASTTHHVRVLSVTFQNRNVLAAGYADSSIRLFDIRNGRLIRTISLGRGPIGGPKEILVWSVKALPDGTLVSGDSTGEIRFWDAKNYSLVQRFKGHQADVLDVAVSADGETVISGGTDRRTVLYRLTPGAKGDKSRRWAEVMHRRYHTHDVKKFAVYETKDMSVAVSGGPDAALVVLPLRQFGKEHHRKLPYLPQTPQLGSSPSSRLIVSFWDREIRLWQISQRPTSLYEDSNHLVGRVLIQGEENITSATLSPDGSLLVVATISSIKVFSVRQPEHGDGTILKIQDVDVPSEISDDGARLVSISPDLQWLSIVRPDSDIFLAKISPGLQQRSPVDWKVIHIERSSSKTTHVEKVLHGTLGNYERTIRSTAFSQDSKLFATGDLSGRVDVWVLEDAEVPMSNSAVQKTPNGVSSSDDESSDDEDAEENVVEGQRWRNLSSLPRLPSGIIFMSFRPGRSHTGKTLTNGLANGFHTSPPLEDRLLVLTSKHQLVEYEVLKGRFSEWSQRNPKSHLPTEFVNVKDRAMGGICGGFQGSEKLLLYGPSWMWVFDLTRDYPSLETAPESGALTKAPSQKRKRTVADEDRAERQKYNSGAGDLIAASQAVVSLGTKVRKIVGKNGPSEEVPVENQRKQRNHEDEDGDDNGNPFLLNGEPDFASLRREMPDEDGTPKRLTNGVHKGEAFRTGQKGASFAVVIDNTLNDDESDRTSREDRKEEPQPTNPLYWHTYKFRDILGIVPFSDPTSMQTSDGKDSGLFKVALVERPIWDVELPDRYARDYE